MRVLALLVLVAPAGAQTPLIQPVPAPGSVTCAWAEGWQSGDLNSSCDYPMCSPPDNWHMDVGECWLSAYCALTDSQWNMPQGTINIPVGVIVGGTIYWQCANMTPGSATIPHTLGTAAVMFALSQYTSDVPLGELPGAEPAWSRVFGMDHLVVMPTHATTQLVGTTQLDSWILEMPVPASPTLVGAYVQCQGVRFDGQFYLSSAMVTRLAN